MLMTDCGQTSRTAHVTNVEEFDLSMRSITATGITIELVRNFCQFDKKFL